MCIRSKQHLVFTTSQQLQQLVQAKKWYVDRTFKLCCQPFSQLFSINAFVTSGKQAKQVPLLFILMSGKRKWDYSAVLQEVLSLLPSPPAVRRITLDFKSALWTVFRELLPNISLQGCLFHWTQALCRHTQVRNKTYLFFKGFLWYVSFFQLGSRAGTGASIPKGQPYTQVHQKADGPALSTRSWHHAHVWAAQWQCHHDLSSRLCPVCSRELDNKYNVASLLLVRLHAANTNKQRHWGVAPQPKTRANNRVHLPFYLVVELLHQEAS